MDDKSAYTSSERKAAKKAARNGQVWSRGKNATHTRSFRNLMAYKKNHPNAIDQFKSELDSLVAKSRGRKSTSKGSKRGSGAGSKSQKSSSGRPAPMNADLSVGRKKSKGRKQAAATRSARVSPNDEVKLLEVRLPDDGSRPYDFAKNAQVQFLGTKKPEAEAETIKPKPAKRLKSREQAEEEWSSIEAGKPAPSAMPARRTSRKRKMRVRFADEVYGDEVEYHSVDHAIRHGRLSNRLCHWLADWPAVTTTTRCRGSSVRVAGCLYCKHGVCCLAPSQQYEQAVLNEAADQPESLRCWYVCTVLSVPHPAGHDHPGIQDGVEHQPPHLDAGGHDGHGDGVPPPAAGDDGTVHPPQEEEGGPLVAHDGGPTRRSSRPTTRAATAAARTHPATAGGGRPGPQLGQGQRAVGGTPRRARPLPRGERGEDAHGRTVEARDVGGHPAHGAEEEQAVGRADPPPRRGGLRLVPREGEQRRPHGGPCLRGEVGGQLRRAQGPRGSQRGRVVGGTGPPALQVVQGPEEEEVEREDARGEGGLARGHRLPLVGGQGRSGGPRGEGGGPVASEVRGAGGGQGEGGALRRQLADQGARAVERKQYKLPNHGKLTPERVALMESIGFRWSMTAKRVTWDERFAQLVEHYNGVRAAAAGMATVVEEGAEAEAEDGGGKAGGVKAEGTEPMDTDAAEGAASEGGVKAEGAAAVKGEEETSDAGEEKPPPPAQQARRSSPRTTPSPSGWPSSARPAAAPSSPAPRSTGSTGSASTGDRSAARRTRRPRRPVRPPRPGDVREQHEEPAQDEPAQGGAGKGARRDGIRV
ncbi:hypothetical protein THAOC_12531, partial [Thalassiosira oceanica]